MGGVDIAYRYTVRIVLPLEDAEMVAEVICLSCGACSNNCIDPLCGVKTSNEDSWVIATFVRIFAVELAAAASQGIEEEDKKAEKTSSGEKVNAAEEVEIKADEKEMFQFITPIFLFDIPLRIKPIVLTKPEFELLREPLKYLMPPVHKYDTDEKNSENLQAQKVKTHEVEVKQPEAFEAVPPVTKPNAYNEYDGSRAGGGKVWSKSKI